MIVFPNPRVEFFIVMHVHVHTSVCTQLHPFQLTLRPLNVDHEVHIEIGHSALLADYQSGSRAGVNFFSSADGKPTTSISVCCVDAVSAACD